MHSTDSQVIRAALGEGVDIVSPPCGNLWPELHRFWIAAGFYASPPRTFRYWDNFEDRPKPQQAWRLGKILFEHFQILRILQYGIFRADYAALKGSGLHFDGRISGGIGC